MSERKVISLEEIKQRAHGTIIGIPDWDNSEEKISVRVRRIDLTTKVMRSKMMPNDLRIIASKAFESSNDDLETLEDDIQQQLEQQDHKIDDFVNLLDNMCQEALLEPTFKEIQQIYPLTLVQKMAIFEWLMQEVKGLKSFRRKS